ncbi:MAG: protease pro-enzyme activation domain-containing protein [Terracidiphilus sp.]
MISMFRSICSAISAAVSRSVSSRSQLLTKTTCYWPGQAALLWVVAFLLLTSLGQAQQSSQVLHNHVRPAVSNGQAALVGSLPPTQKMQLSIVLPLRNQAKLAALLGQLYDPSSPNYRHFLSVDQFTEQFSPTAEDYQTLVDFAKANGLTVSRTSANRLVVPVNGTVAQVEKAFNVRMNNYQHPTEKRTFFSPDREPSVPAGLSIRHITGLNNYSLPMSMTVPLPKGAKGADVEGSGPGNNYVASDMRAAYYGGTALTGRGQTLGLVQFDGYAIDDVISAFNGAATLSTSGADSVVNYTPPNSQTTYSIPIHNVLLDQATGAPGQFISPIADAEQVLDIVQSIGMAPGLNQVRVYIGSNDVDILSAISSENLANEVSISWAWMPDDPSAADQFFQEMAAQGQSVFVASGDYGAYSSNSQYYFPAEDDWVTAVGGTTLMTNGAGGPFLSESAWDQSGGGISPDSIPIPAWQAGIATSSNLASTTSRNIPDVAMEADFDNFNCNMGTCSEGWAGTSFASPRWAGYIALVNEQATASGEAPVGFINTWLYNSGQSPEYGSEFHDVVSGENDYEPGYGFYAVPGYDLATGWGSPAGQNLIDAMAPQAGTIGFQLTTTQSGLTISPGSSATTTIGVNYLGAFSGNVSLAVTSTLPNGVSTSFGTNPTTGSSTLTIAANFLTNAQVYVVTVTGSAGSVQATTYITVNTPTNAVVITTPVVPVVPVTAEVFKPGAFVSVGGTILGNPQSIQLQWAPGINPTSGWSSPGITQSAGISAPFSNVTIGTWDTSSITTAGYYSIQLSAVYPEGTVAATTVIYLEPDLLSSNWPKWIDTVPDVSLGSGIRPVDDGNGNTELSFIEPTYLNASDSAPRYRIFSPDGSSDQSVALAYGSYPSPAFGHLTAGDKGAAIMADARNLLLIENGSAASSFPLGGANVDFTLAQTVLADLKGDSTLVTIAYGDQCWNQLAFVYAWDSNQLPLNSNFPIQLPCENAYAPFSNPGIAVGDIDGDGKQQIIALETPTSTTFTFGLFANDGTPRTWAAPTFDGAPEKMILVDLDGNGKLELVIGAYPPNAQYVLLHVLQPDGTERNGWPIQLPGLNSLAAGDLARTGTEQIVASAGYHLFVLNSDGTFFSPAWPLTTNPWSGLGPVVLADVDGDGYPEILVANGNYSAPWLSAKTTTIPSSYSPSSPPSSSSQAVVTPSRSRADAFGSDSASTYYDPVVQAYHRDGTLVKSWHIPGMHGEQPWEMASLAVGDFNHDGITDIAVLDGLISGGGTGGSVSEATMEVLSTGFPYNPSASAWPMMNHDAYNSVSAYPLTVNSPQTNTPAFSLTQPVAINDTTPGAVIYYTTDGSTPTANSTIYWGPITVSTAETIRAIAIAAGYTASDVVSAAYTTEIPTATVLTISPNSTSLLAASSYLLTATVTPASGTTVPSGSVVFTIGSTAQTVALNAFGVATYTTTAPAASGSLTLSAAYQGSTEFSSSTSNSLTENIVTIPVVTWATPAPIIYGTPLGSTQLNASSNVAGTFTYSPAAGAVLTAGQQTLTTTFTPTDTADYTTVTATVTLTVNQATPVITWSVPTSITYGTPLSVTQLNATANVPGMFNYSPAAGTVLGLGTQTLTAVFAPADSVDYASVTASVPLTVTPPFSFVSSKVNLGTAKIGTKSPVQTLTVTFDAQSIFGSTSVTTQGASELDFRNAGTGTCKTNTLYNTGQSCTVNVLFEPTFAGTRYGAANLHNATGNVIATAYLQGTGIGPQMNFLPGTESVLPISGPIVPLGMAVDGSGNLYVAEIQGNVILKETLSGGTYITSIIPTSQLADPHGVAVDGAGNIYIADSSNYRILKEVPSASGYLESVVASFPSDGSVFPMALAVDGMGNVYISSSSGSLYVESLIADNYVESTISTGTSSLAGVAVDGAGNVYVVDDVNIQILKETPFAGSYLQSTIPITGLISPVDMTVDPRGNIYITDDGTNTVFVETQTNGSYAQSTLSTSPLNGPSGIAVDGAGNIYLGDSENSRVLKEDLSDPPSLTFASTAAGSISTDSPQTVTVENVGNAALNFSAVSYPSSFQESSQETTDCTTTTTLSANQTCTLTIDFSPLTAGALSGSLVLTDNALNGNLATQSISLSGTGTASPSFTLSDSLGSLTVVQGKSGSSTITVKDVNGFTGKVTLAASGLPSGVTAAFGTNPTAGTSVLKLTASSTATVGASTITIKGTSGSLVATTTLSLTIPAPGFTLSDSPGSLTVIQGKSGISTVTVYDVNGFTGKVTLAASGLPSGVTAAFATNPTAGTSVLTLTASSTATVGTSTITIKGTSGSLTAATTLALTIPAPSFTLSDAPGSLTVVQGKSGTSTVTVNDLNGFTGKVTLAASGLPSGVTAAFATNPNTGSSVLTLTASSTATVGTATVTIKGTSGSLTASTTIALTVSCAPTTIVPYISINGGSTWTEESSATVSSTSTKVDLGPQPSSGGSWSWTGPNKYTSTSRQISSIPLTVGTDAYVATYTNASGCKSSETFTITVK